MTNDKPTPDAPLPAPPAPRPSTLALRIKETDLVALETLAEECAALATSELTPFRRTFLMAAGMAELRKLITPAMMVDVMALQGSSLGFRTDKDDKGGYEMETVKEVAIEATLRGLRLVGNEINIIAGRLYAAKDGLKRLVREWPGLTRLRFRIGIPTSREGFTVVPIQATWRMHGVEQTEECTGDGAIPIRVNREQIVDAIIGKAVRKMYARIYDRLTGQDNGLVDPEDEAIEAESEEVDEGGRGKAEGGKNTTANAPTEADHQDQERRIAKYAIDLGVSQDLAQTGAVMRRAAQDADLGPASKKRVQELGNDRMQQIRGQRGERTN